MADEKPWGVMNPNSEHQLWSKWEFRIYPGGRRPDFKTVEENYRCWLQETFRTTMGQARIVLKFVTMDKTPIVYYVGEAYVEGIPAHDPALVAHVRQQFLRNFTQKGFGPLATSDVKATIVAGSRQDGRPADQLVVMPSIMGR